MKNAQLGELPSMQLTLGQWLALHPNSTILQPDTIFKKSYDGLADYDRGTIKGGLEKRDSASWKPKSWVIGVRTGDKASKAYDWNTLAGSGLIQDTVGAVPVVLLLGEDSMSYRVGTHGWRVRRFGSNGSRVRKFFWTPIPGRPGPSPGFASAGH